MRVFFRVVAQTGHKQGKCVVCGKFTKRSRRIAYTINPFNKNAEGVPKRYEEVKKDVVQETMRWRNEPIKHAKCE